MHFQPIDHSGGDDAYLAQGGGGGGAGGALDLEVAQGRADISDTYDPFDDVFGSSGEAVEAEASLDRPGSHNHHSTTDTAAHPSDIHRLQTEHTTAGYREGITAAKESTVQAGFDEGFSLGATIGLAAGQLLGTLQGIEEALKNVKNQHHPDDSSGSNAADPANNLLAEAREELSITRIFSPEFWAPDGNWSYDVQHAAGGEEVLFPDVASAHPLIKKWTGIVDEQIKLWKMNRTVMGVEEGEGEGEGGEERRILPVGDEPALISLAAPTATATTTSTSSKKALDW
ncbi:Protein yae1 [Cladobotryum mycophilum]|uniref:Protein YAE1 n=1 Tax=Cladobotryum mycophilum TaxID=491253 RepID=A0ABR0T335_9HYPO